LGKAVPSASVTLLGSSAKPTDCFGGVPRRAPKTVLVIRAEFELGLCVTSLGTLPQRVQLGLRGALGLLAEAKRRKGENGKCDDRRCSGHAEYFVLRRFQLYIRPDRLDS
jgi:hypothetical protein